ncbi:MAG: hypothetical protein OZSIB_3709 [Candidatus Ozemobacter sibiricus]|uniref:Uncharacterized protein n=1 Tax=Candidatus Ozemobacter sibiricus TaxID=2268124 RepID=A0A367ZDY5_9BACT|nr:MAG: hypothetical protein OZSIB_3709 [Candidatus Ozemobacter sibiricus]
MLRRILSCCLLGAFLLAVVLNTGCGGGGGGGGFFAGLATFVLIVAATGGTAGTAAAFAANVRTSPQSAVAAQAAVRTISINGDKIKVKITPMKDGQAVGATLYINTADLKAEGQVLKGQSTVEYSQKEFRVEIVSGDSEIVLLKGIKGVEAIPADTKVNAAIDPVETAKAITYEKWVSGSPDKSFAAFEYNLAKTTGAVASLTDLANTIQTTLANHTAPFTTQILESSTIQDTAQANASGISKDVPPTTVPETKTISDPVEQPSTQVKYAIAESTNTALTGVPLRSLRMETAPMAPSVVPVIGGNTALNLEGMKNILMTALTGGTRVYDGPEVDNPEMMVATFTETAVSIEQYRYTVIWGSNPPQMQRNPYPSIRRVLSNIKAQKTGDVVTQIEIGASSTLELVEINGQTGAILQRNVLKIVNDGLTGVIGFREYNNQGIFYPEALNTNWTYRYTQSASETVNVTLNGNLIVDFETQEYANNTVAETIRGRLSLSGISGSMSATKGFLYGQYYYGTTPMGFPFAPKVNFGALNSDDGAANLNLGTTVVIAGSGKSTSGISLDNLTITLNNVQKSGSGRTLTFSCSNSSVNTLLTYTGSSPEAYGYIKSLAVAISNFSFNSANNPMVPNGTTITVTKVNTDNTTDTITYTTENNQIVLSSGSTKFGGGRETVTNLANGDLQVQGEVTLANSNGKKVSLKYTATKAKSSGDITVTVNLSGEIVTGTIAFTLTPNSTTTLITNGTYQAGSVSGTFTLNRNGTGMLTIGNQTLNFALHGTGSPLASLLALQ